MLSVCTNGVRSNRRPLSITCQAKSVSTFARRYRDRQSLPFINLNDKVTSAITTYLGKTHTRSFSHAYRQYKYSLPRTTKVISVGRIPDIISNSQILAIQGGLINASQNRSFSSLHRRYRRNLLSQLSQLLPWLSTTQEKPTPTKYPSKTVSEMLASRSFSHVYRERQMSYLRAYLPVQAFNNRHRRSVSSVPLLTHMTESEQAERNRRRRSLILRAMAAGITVLLALQFLKEQEAVESTVLNSSTYVPFKLVSVDAVSPTASIFTLRSANEHAIPNSTPIASVSIKDPSANIQRPYTVLSVDGHHITLLVKKYESGDLSRFIHSRKTGSDLYLRLADPSYRLPAKVPARYLLISGGTGIATAYQLIKHFSSMPLSERPTFEVLYASLSKEEIYLKSEFEALEREFGGEKLIVRHFVDADGTRIGIADVKRAVARGEAAAATTTTLVCGSDGFTTFIAGAKPENGQGEIGGLLADAGVRENVWKL